MKNRSAIFVIAALLIAAAVGLLRLSDKTVTDMPATDMPVTDMPATDMPATSDPPAADSVPAAETPAADTEDLNVSMPPMEVYAAACFRDMRLRNPRGRILSLTANRLADRCAVIVETNERSGRWMFDWRDYNRGFIHEGELRWPDVWPVGVPQQGIEDVEAFAEGAVALMADARSSWPDVPHAEWLYEIHWLPAPFSRPLVFISLADRRSDAAPYASLDLIFDGQQVLAGETAEQAKGLYPVTRFELREDHNFKGPIYESTALAEAATSLETADVGLPTHPLAETAEQCVALLRSVLLGRRVLRVSMNALECFMVFENPNTRDDYYLISARGPQDYTELKSLLLPTTPAANLLLDRGRLSAARVRERLDQAQKAGGETWEIKRLAIAFADGDMVWQFDGPLGAERMQVYLNEAGALIEQPTEFPLSAHELDQGFAPTTPVLPFVN